VIDIVTAHEQGVSPIELQNHFDARPLTPGEIHAALAYYNDHKHEVEAAFAEDARSTAEGVAREAELLSRPPAG
jgi:hypothetical protein